MSRKGQGLPIGKVDERVGILLVANNRDECDAH